MIELYNVTGGYDKQKPTVRDITFTVDKGSFVALLGPNGSGKTTLIRLIMNVLTTQSGEVKVEGKSVKAYSPKQLAQKVAVMTQENQIGLEFTVQEIVSLGRYPYQAKGLFSTVSAQDEEVVESVMKLTNVWHYRNHTFQSLSGGEKQRVLLAKALAQEPDYLLLDEPTNHLDVKHTMELLQLLKTLQQEMSLTVLAILHDLNIASLFADNAVLLKDGRVEETGMDAIFQDAATLKRVYGVDLHVFHHPAVNKRQIAFVPPYQYPETDFHELYQLQKEPGKLCLSFARPLRTLSLGSNETGLDWCQEIVQQQSSSNTAWKSASLSSHEVRLKDDKGYSWLTVLTHGQKENETNIVLLTNTPLSDANLLHAAMKVIEYRAFLGKTGRIVVASSHHKEENQEEISTFLMERLQKELQLFMETKMTDNCFK